MIPLSLIQAFCSTDETRYILTQPREIDGKIVATNGRSMIEISASEVEPLTEPPIDGNYPDYKPLLEGPFLAPLGDPVEIPALPEMPESQECEACAGTGKTWCPACCHTNPCDDCDGIGSYRDLSKWTVEVGGVLLNCQYVRDAMALPSPVFYKPENGDYISPVRFTFGNGGRGLIMQTRKANQ
jgi:hypothetical protein